MSNYVKLYQHFRDFDEEFNGVYADPNDPFFGTGDWILINNKPILQKLSPTNSSKYEDKCIWWDKSERIWLLGFCEDLGTKKAQVSFHFLQT